MCRGFPADRRQGIGSPVRSPRTAVVHLCARPIIEASWHAESTGRVEPRPSIVMPFDLEDHEVPVKPIGASGTSERCNARLGGLGRVLSLTPVSP